VCVQFVVRWDDNLTILCGPEKQHVVVVNTCFSLQHAWLNYDNNIMIIIQKIENYYSRIGSTRSSRLTGIVVHVLCNLQFFVIFFLVQPYSHLSCYSPAFQCTLHALGTRHLLTHTHKCSQSLKLNLPMHSYGWFANLMLAKASRYTVLK
jgi:hypothetical protein